MRRILAIFLPWANLWGDAGTRGRGDTGVRDAPGGQGAGSGTRNGMEWIRMSPTAVLRPDQAHATSFFTALVCANDANCANLFRGVQIGVPQERVYCCT
jgi:hypothetical protein